ncbi:MAG: hypothetical protein GWO24_36925 [Akkermansiaceae bacterium]|nr:hypothetical protein [Akkermansiaceae bacterium]NIW77634.1 hypothetical protein [Gemmatimonadota bacterium]
METAEREARRALARLKRSLEKSARELDTLRGALETAEGEDFPQHDYAELRARLDDAMRWADSEGARLQAKILHAGGLEPGRIRRG